MTAGGLVFGPKLNELERAYAELYGEPVSVAALCLYARWVRFDPRLGEIWVEHVSKHWMGWSALELGQENFSLKWPNVLGPLLDTVEILIRVRGASKDLEKFKKWSLLCLHGIVIPKASSTELFFFGIGKLGGKLVQKEAALSLELYERWGFLSRALLINKASSINMTLVSKRRRMIALKSLLEKTDRITVGLYRQSLDYLVSRRQAERDLGKASGLVARGETRGRFYVRSGASLSECVP